MRQNASQRGAASLIVVLLLFMVLSLTAAYTSRNLIFEQKTSANQARSTAAFESAEAGIEWTLAQLNGARIDDSCVESTAASAASFQQRYLSIASTSVITPTPRAPGNLSPRLWPTCVFDANANAWNCACPVAADANPVAPAGNGSFPAFRVWPAVYEACNSTTSPWGPVCYPNQQPAGPRMLALSVAGCTRLPATAAETCLNYLPRGAIGEGLAALNVMLVLRSGLATSPAAAVTARLDVLPAASPAPKLAVVNADQRSKGWTVNTSLVIDQGRFIASSVPGTPAEFSFADEDSKLDFQVAPAGSSTYGPELTRGDRMFVTIFGMKRQTYKEQPGLRRCASPCSATAINALMADNPNRIIWVEGDLTLDANIGAPATVPPAPVLLIVDGQTLTLDPGVQIYGFVYMTGGATEISTIALPDGVTGITGALVAEGRLRTSYSGSPAATSLLTVTYDAAALDLLRTSYGSWVRVGGTWRDYRVSP